ncbi:MAG: response regulator [Anaerolineae bacterium]
MRKTRVIIADNHSLFRQGLKRVIEQEKNLEVIQEAANGEEALKLILELKPDALLMDMNLPKDGPEFTREIKEKHPDVEVIVFNVQTVAPAIATLRELPQKMQIL